MSSGTSSISTLLADALGQHVTHDTGVWRIDGTSREIEGLKVALLRSICLNDSPFVHYDEPPKNDTLVTTSKSTMRGQWRVRRGADGFELLEWLYLGNWQLYIANTPLNSIPDLCRAGAREVRGFIESSNVSLIIDSFHDDNHWTIGLAANDA